MCDDCLLRQHTRQLNWGLRALRSSNINSRAPHPSLQWLWYYTKRIELIHSPSNLRTTPSQEKYLSFVEDRAFNDLRYTVNSEALKRLGWKEQVRVHGHLNAFMLAVGGGGGNGGWDDTCWHVCCWSGWVCIGCAW